jgi:hypothetical protein
MIRYRLRCTGGHEFDAWFPNMATYDGLAAAGDVTCATCGVTTVERAPMAPSIVGRTGSSPRAGEAQDTSPDRDTAGARTADAAPASVDTASVDTADADRVWSTRRREMAVLRRLRDELLARSEYVGPRFAAEARRRHGEDEGTPRTAIHGEATVEEVRGLLDDGIEVAPVPVLPDDRN